jgi:hypothetical protein
MPLLCGVRIGHEYVATCTCALMLWSENVHRFADVRQFVALTYSGYTMSDGTEFTGEKSADFLVIEDKYYGEDILHLCMRAVCTLCLHDKLAERASKTMGLAGNALHVVLNIAIFLFLFLFLSFGYACTRMPATIVAYFLPF